ncbi:DUF5685 family protein [Thermodesulfobacteriota bacterium]
MFGLLKGCSLKGSTRQDWISHYCGLCLALKRDHGHLSRMFTHTDAVVLSTLCEAQSSLPLEREDCRCPFRRFRKIQVLKPENHFSRYGALISVLIGSSKVIDHVRDGDTWIRYFPGLFSRVASRWLESARGRAKEMGIDISGIELQLDRQTILEKQVCRDFFFYSEPTETASGIACSSTALVADSPANVDPLYSVGRMYGRIIYLIDSYRDYRSDMARGKFNPLARCFSEPEIQDQARTIFQNAHQKLRHYFNRLSLFRPELCSALVIGQLAGTGTTILNMDLDELGQVDPTDEVAKRKWSDWFSCDCCDCGYCGDCEPSCGGDGCGCDGCPCDGCPCDACSCDC